MLRYVLISADPETSRPQGSGYAAGWGWSDGFNSLQREFPTIIFQATPKVMHLTPVVRVADWQTLAWDPKRFDAEILRLGSTGPQRLNVRGALAWHTAAAVFEILTRYQCLLGRTNSFSRVPLFTALLRRHRELHDTSKPLVLAECLHGLDTWQWVLRLAPTASLELQVAALFHDIERLVSEADLRVEHQSNDYAEFKADHAQRSGDMVVRCLSDLHAPAQLIARVQRLVAHHENGARDPEVQILNDADALSFFALLSSTFLDDFDVEHTRRKISFALAHTRRSTWSRLRLIRYRADFERILVQVLRDESLEDSRRRRQAIHLSGADDLQPA